MAISLIPLVTDTKKRNAFHSSSIMLDYGLDNGTRSMRRRKKLQVRKPKRPAQKRENNTWVQRNKLLK